MALITRQMLKTYPEWHKSHKKIEVDLEVKKASYWSVVHGVAELHFRSHQPNGEPKHKHHEAFLTETEVKQVVRDLLPLLYEESQMELLIELDENFVNKSRDLHASLPLHSRLGVRHRIRSVRQVSS